MMRPLNVMYVLNSSGGGATQGILELLKALPADRSHAYIVTPNTPTPRQKETFARLAVDFSVVPMAWWNRRTRLPVWWRLPVWISTNLRTLFRLRSIVSLIQLSKKWHIDIIYSSSAVILDGAIAARLMGLPHIWHIKETIGQNGRMKFPIPDFFLARLLVHSSDRLLVMSHFIGQFFERQKLSGRITVINDGVDVASFTGHSRGKELRARLNVAGSELLIGMVASLSSTWKQHDLFISIAARITQEFANVRFVALGPEPQQFSNPAYNGPWQYYSDLRSRVEQLGLGDRFIWAGFCPDIPQLMDALDIVIHPCDSEPFGRVAIEAMAAQRPVVGPAQGGISESVIDHETGFLVSPRDVDSFVQATRMLILNADLRKNMGAAGRIHVEDRFPLDKHANQISQLYEELMRPCST